MNEDLALHLYGFVSPLPDLPELDGVEEGSRVVLVESDAVGCLVSRVDPAAYQQLSQLTTAAAQLDWVTPRAWRHHEVLRQVHTTTAVIPLKFGTLCRSVEDVRSMLTDRRVRIGELLDQARGKDEWTVQMSADREAAATVVEGTDSQLLEMKARERRLPEGRAYFLRKQRQRIMDDRLAQLFETLRIGLCSLLTASGLQLATVSPPRCPSGHIVTLALLVPRNRFSDVKATLAEFEAEHADLRIAFELVGPWPPYNFAGGIA